MKHILSAITVFAATALLLSACHKVVPVSGRYQTANEQIHMDFKTTTTANLFFPGESPWSGVWTDVDYTQSGDALTFTMTRAHHRGLGGDCGSVVVNAKIVNDGAQIDLTRFECPESSKSVDISSLPNGTKDFELSKVLVN